MLIQHLCGGKRPVPQSHFLCFKMAQLSPELAKDGNTICLGMDLRVQKGLKGGRAKQHRVASFVGKPKKQSQVQDPLYILEILGILYSFMGI